jgi:hypothetical protein
MSRHGRMLEFSRWQAIRIEIRIEFSSWQANPSLAAAKPEFGS